MIKKLNIFIFFLSLIVLNNKIFPLPLIKKNPELNLPSKNSFLKNSEFIKDFKYKKITIAEYLTDPLILYTGLWGCFSITLPLWETNKGLSEKDENYWEPYNYRGFEYFSSDPLNVYLLRITPEPFGVNHYGLRNVDPRTIRIDPITKEVNGITVLRNDFYVKNLIEPLYFTFLALYLKAKNYHPAILIAEIVILSLCYEFTIRPFYLNSSLEQLIKNPAIGVVLAILLDEISTYLLTTPYKILHIIAYLLNPFNALPTARVHTLLFFDPYKKAPSLEAVIKF